MSSSDMRTSASSVSQGGGLRRVVVFIHPNFSDGGVERTNIGLAKALIGRGYRVKFITTSFTNHFLSELEDAQIELVSTGHATMSRSIWTIFNIIKRDSQINNRLYIISCQYYVNVLMTPVTYFLKRKYDNVTFIYSERNHLVDLEINGRIKDKIVKWLIPICYRFADKVIANAQETSNDLESVIRLPVTTVYNPSVSDRLDRLASENVVESWFVSDPRPVIVAVGRLVFQKGFDVLLNAFALLRKELDCRLLILGDGPERERLTHQAEALGIGDDLIMPGFVSNPYKFMKASQVFVLSSRYEGLPNVLIEAAYLGMACVSFACKSGPREILLDGAAGMLVDPGDVLGLATAMHRLMTDENERFAMSSAAKQSALRFSSSSAVGALERVLLA